MNKLLVVDDSEFFLMLIKSLLDRTGCTVLTASNPEDALNLINNEKPEIILLDQYLPGMTGDEICGQIKNAPTTKDNIVIMLTQSNKQTDIDKCFAAGCDEYLTKPINKEDFLNSLSKYMPIVKRKYERAPIYESFKYSQIDSSMEYFGHIHVISVGGSFIMGERMMPVNSIINMKFSISGVSEELEVKGKVVWSFDSKEKFPQLLSTAQGMGIKFLDISDEAKNAIAKYMAMGNFVV